MEGFNISIEVSLRDCLKFQSFMVNARLEQVYGFEVEQFASNIWYLNSDAWLEDFEIQELVNELEEICSDYEVEIYWEQD